MALARQPHEGVEEFAARLVVYATCGLDLVFVDVPPAQKKWDFEIYRDGKRVGCLEVGRNTDSRERKHAQAFEKYGMEAIDAPTLNKSWRVGFYRATWKNVATWLIPLLQELEQEGIFDFDLYHRDAWKPGTAPGTLQQRGVKFATSSTTGPPTVSLAKMSGFTSGLDPNTAVEASVAWLSSDAKDPAGIRTKLNAGPGPERHAYIWLDMSGSAQLWRPLWEGSPTAPPTLPPGISSLWLVHNRGWWWSGQQWIEVAAVAESSLEARKQFGLD